MTILLCSSLAIHSVLTAFLSSAHSNTLEGGNGILFSSRARRAMPDIISTILKTAWVKYSVQGYIQYRKLGNYKNALRDFRRLNPTDVTEDGRWVRGKIGDTVVELHNTARRRRKNKNGADMTIFIKDGTKVEKVSIHYVPKH